jgi:hypothetical protein
VLETLHQHADPGAKIAFWNRLSDRTCTITNPHWQPLTDLATRLHSQDQVFFYKRFVVVQSPVSFASKIVSED